MDVRDQNKRQRVQGVLDETPQAVLEYEQLNRRVYQAQYRGIISTPVELRFAQPNPWTLALRC